MIFTAYNVYAGYLRWLSNQEITLASSPCYTCGLQTPLQTKGVCGT